MKDRLTEIQQRLEILYSKRKPPEPAERSEQTLEELDEQMSIRTEISQLEKEQEELLAHL